jgi:hypothetical protein
MGSKGIVVHLGPGDPENGESRGQPPIGVDASEGRDELATGEVSARAEDHDLTRDAARR